jgi:hypothetical protein
MQLSASTFLRRWSCIPLLSLLEGDLIDTVAEILCDCVKAALVVKLTAAATLHHIMDTIDVLPEGLSLFSCLRGGLLLGMAVGRTRFVFLVAFGWLARPA